MRLLKQKMGNKIKGTHGQVMLFTQLNSPNIANFCAFGKICSNDPERNFRCHCPMFGLSGNGLILHFPLK